MADLRDIKPAYTCDCGCKYMFLMPPNCNQCGRPIVPEDHWAKFDAVGYHKFKKEMDKTVNETE